MVYPDYADILLGLSTTTRDGYTRAQAAQLDFHPGNRLWRENMDENAVLFLDYKRGLPPAFSSGLAAAVMEQTLTSGGNGERVRRFLQQVVGGWVELTDEKATTLTERGLEDSIFRIPFQRGGPCQRSKDRVLQCHRHVVIERMMESRSNEPTDAMTEMVRPVIESDVGGGKGTRMNLMVLISLAVIPIKLGNEG